MILYVSPTLSHPQPMIVQRRAQSIISGDFIGLLLLIQTNVEMLGCHVMVTFVSKYHGKTSLPNKSSRIVMSIAGVMLFAVGT